MLIGTPFICHPWGSLADMGTPPTQEKVVTYLLKPPDLAIKGWSQSITAPTAKPDLQDSSTLY